MKGHIRSKQAQKCFLCGKTVKGNEINKNDFYIACFEHKAAAKISTEAFFESNRDFKKWNAENETTKNNPDF